MYIFLNIYFQSKYVFIIQVAFKLSNQPSHTKLIPLDLNFFYKKKNINNN